MWKSKDVYYLSDSTGILATNLGQSLLCQFPETSFHEETFAFIRTIPEAEKVLAYILKNSAARRPIIFSTIMTEEVLKVFDTPEVEFFDAYHFFLSRLEECLETKPLRVPGYSRRTDDVSMAKRAAAINFCLEHDDGTKIEELDESDVILLGVSRAGKTPVSVYLATQHGLKSANFPLTVEYLNQYRLPEGVRRNSRRTVGLTTTPELLHSVREKRYPGSKYAKMSTCIEELQQAEQIFMKHNIPVIDTHGKSIEEIATEVCQEIGLSKKPTNLNNNS